VRALAKDSAWVRNHENIFVIGPCGVGKSFLASALAQKAEVNPFAETVCVSTPAVRFSD
jgi:DNA replication protein DnaC